jgi:hypothetical protein
MFNTGSKIAAPPSKRPKARGSDGGEQALRPLGEDFELVSKSLAFARYALAPLYNVYLGPHCFIGVRGHDSR